MPNALEARLRRLKPGATIKKFFIVVANKAECDALARDGGIPAGAEIIIKCYPQ